MLTLLTIAPALPIFSEAQRRRLYPLDHDGSCTSLLLT